MRAFFQLIIGVSAAATACSVDKVTFTLGEDPPEGCAGGTAAAEQCDGVDNDCNGTVDDNEALGRARSCAAASCADIRDHNPASAGGVWWIDPSGAAPFEVYCDQTTDGGGWGLVWRNHGGARGGEESNAALLARATGGAGDAIVLPPAAALTSAIHQEMYDAYWSSPDREWIKITTLWNDAGEIVNEQHIRVEMRSITMQSIFAVPVDRCFQAPDRMRVVVNGTVDFGETNIINHYSEETYGLANNGNLAEDLCAQPQSNLIADPAPGADSLYRLDSGDSTNAIRHLFSYVHTSTGRDTSRCLYACWADPQGYYDGWVWAVR